MKRFAISAAMIIIGFFLIFWGVSSIRNSQKLMMEELDKSVVYFENKDKNTALIHFENAKQLWEKSKTLSIAILGNGTVDEIQMTLNETTATIKLKEKEDAILSICVLKEQINSVYFSEHASLQNMF